jgi:glyoxylase-like metal-dependent hydrolase (beta-lactamase superfamily II)
MDRKRKIILAVSAVILLLITLLVVEWQSSFLQRLAFSAPKASSNNWEDILSHPKPISVQTYSTGTMKINLSGIMNMEHERALTIEDLEVEIPVNVGVIQHDEYGAYLIDAGLDSSYVDSPNGTIKGLFVKSYLGRGSQEPNTHIAATLENENIQIEGVWLTHLHLDHTAGILDLPKNIPYVAGKGERYINFRFFMQSDHFAGIDVLHEIDFDKGIDLPPFGRSIDVFGDGSLWAISASGHSKGQVMYFINGTEDKVLLTGDACNTLYQYESGIGPGYFSSDLEQGQDVLDQIIEFKEIYPEVKLVFGHELQSR